MSPFCTGKKIFYSTKLVDNSDSSTCSLRNHFAKTVRTVTTLPTAGGGGISYSATATTKLRIWRLFSELKFQDICINGLLDIQHCLTHFHSRKFLHSFKEHYVFSHQQVLFKNCMAFYSLTQMNELNITFYYLSPTKKTLDCLSPVDSINTFIYISTMLLKLYHHTGKLEILLLISQFKEKISGANKEVSRSTSRICLINLLIGLSPSPSLLSSNISHETSEKN